MVRYMDWTENLKKSSQYPKNYLKDIQKASRSFLKTILRIYETVRLP